MSEVTGHTRIVFILADPVQQVKGAAFLNTHFCANAFDAVCVPLHVAPVALDNAVAAIRHMQNVAGFGCTIPHKVAIIPLLDRLTERARLINAVNFVKRIPDGTLVGDNLDAAGFIGGLHARGFSARGKRVLQIGAGGAGRATAFALSQDGACQIMIYNRDSRKAEELARDLRAANPHIDAQIGLAAAEDFDLVINATSLGLNSTDALPVDISRVGKDVVVYDIIANPPVTRLMAEAEKRGATSIGGGAMLHEQISLVADFVLGPNIDLT